VSEVSRVLPQVSSLMLNVHVWQRIKKIVVPAKFILINSVLLAVMTMRSIY